MFQHLMLGFVNMPKCNICLTETHRSIHFQTVADPRYRRLGKSVK